MFCPSCKKPLAEDAAFCSSCGQPLAAPGRPVPAPGARPAPPVGPPETSGKAIASLICGLFALFFPAAIAAIVLGHLSRSEIRRSAGRLQGAGVALAGLILGYLGVAVIPMLIIAAIAIPNLLRSRLVANEASSVGSLRTLNTALFTYYSTYGTGFPASLEQLGPPPSGSQPSAEAADFVEPGLASGSKSGYVFVYEPSDTDGDGLLDVYTLTANPVAPGRTGTRYFFTNETGIIRYEGYRPADANSPPL